MLCYNSDVQKAQRATLYNRKPNKDCEALFGKTKQLGELKGPHIYLPYKPAQSVSENAWCDS